MRTITALAALCTLAACTGERPSASATAARDLVVADTLLVIGADDARPGHALHMVRHAVREPSGRLLLADGSSGEARVFDERGDLLATLGRRGNGPGEHQALAWVRALHGDTIETYDGLSRRLTYWSPAGTPARDHRFDNAEHLPAAPAGDDAVLAVRLMRAGRFPVGTAHTDTAIISLIRASDDAPLELANVPYETRFAATPPTGGVIYTPLPLEPKTAYAAGRSAVYFGHSATGTIRRFDLTGVELPPIELNAPRAPLTAEARSAWQQPLIDRMPPAQQQAMREYLDQLPYGDSLPVFDTIVVDDIERVWVRLFPTPGHEMATWRVFDGNGETARLRLRSDQRLLHAGADFVVIGDTREDGAEIVLVLRIREHVPGAG